MKLVGLLLLIFAPTMALAELTIFDVRRTLPMSNDEKAYRDFYINGGSEQGLQPGMVIVVQRRQPLYDSYQNRSAGDLDLRVARVKIIHVQRGLAVARLHSEFSRENAPLLEDPFLMVGDRLDIGSATYDKTDKNKKAESGEQNEPVAALGAPSQIVVNSVELAPPQPKNMPITPNANVETTALQ